jgi:hypothetical protein
MTKFWISHPIKYTGLQFFCLPHLTCERSIGMVKIEQPKAIKKVPLGLTIFTLFWFDDGSLILTDRR